MLAGCHPVVLPLLKLSDDQIGQLPGHRDFAAEAELRIGPVFALVAGSSFPSGCIELPAETDMVAVAGGWCWASTYYCCCTLVGPEFGSAVVGIGSWVPLQHRLTGQLNEPVQ